MKLARLLGTAAVGVLMLSSTALAGYQPSQDQSVSVNVLPGVVRLSSTTGTFTFALQETVHRTVTSTTGISVPHYYYWVYVNGVPVAAVDPIFAYDW